MLLLSSIPPQIALAGAQGTMLDRNDTTISSNVSTETPNAITAQVATLYAAAGYEAHLVSMASAEM